MPQFLNNQIDSTQLLRLSQHKSKYPENPDAWDKEAGPFYYEKFKPEVMDSLKARNINPSIFNAYAAKTK